MNDLWRNGSVGISFVIKSPDSVIRLTPGLLTSAQREELMYRNVTRGVSKGALGDLIPHSLNLMVDWFAFVALMMSQPTTIHMRHA